jgi:ribonuclease J
MPKDKIHLLADGQIISFDQNGVARLEEVLDLKTIIVDGSGVGDVGPVVLSDRKKMSQEGIVVVTIPVKQGTNQIVGQAEIISRGFVYMKRSKDLMEEAKRIIQKDLPELGKVSDWIKTRTKIEKDLGNLFYKETGREPMILPVIVKI